jgi:SAM-dependent methyltransferase
MPSVQDPEQKMASNVASFRDPGGSLVRQSGRILRRVNADAAEGFEQFLRTGMARDAMAAGRLVQTVRIPSTPLPFTQSEPSDALYEHERVWFPTYPYEWPAEMLAAAGNLTLDLFREALPHGYGLKDATPYNVLFRGASPVFVDMLSFEARNAQDSSWLAYAQFIRTFLLPLLVARHFGLSPASVFLSQRDGLEPAQVYQWASLHQKLRPEFLSLVTLPHWLTDRAATSTYRPKPASSADQASFILDRLIRSCQKRLTRLMPDANADSTWSGYLDHKSLYSPAQLAQKEAFVAEALDFADARQVLDVGANEGRFSFLAARKGASVVAIDTDPTVVGRIWRQAKEDQLDVLPLVVDLARPTPATGWRNQECDSFLDRATQSFDLVMMLAVVHHILVTERVPLDQLLDLVADLTRQWAIIEFVSPEDAMFQGLLRGRDALYQHLTAANFESAVQQRFEIIRSQKVDGMHRCLYLLRRR